MCALNIDFGGILDLLELDWQLAAMFNMRTERFSQSN